MFICMQLKLIQMLLYNQYISNNKLAVNANKEASGTKGLMACL